MARRDGRVASAVIEPRDGFERDVLAALAEISAQLAVIATRLADQAPAPDRSWQPDARHVELFEALATTLGDLDLPFTAAEVIDAARLDHRLDRALVALAVPTVPRLGALFRVLRGRVVVDWRLMRAGRRDWQLTRT